MNRFETLLAPPSLTPKELSIHINMHPEIPRDVSGKCKNDFANVATRLHDELTTLRFRRTLANAPAPTRYEEVNRRLTGSTATPIEWRFFAGEFEEFISDHPERLDARRTLAAVRSLADPWRLQAWAAQALRIAQNAEIEDPHHAPNAWRAAVELFTTFFGRADVTQSHTYRAQTDPSAQAMCRAAWDSFLADEVGALAQRITDYSHRGQADAASAALAVLAVPTVAAANPDAARRATGAAQEAFVSGIRSASSLRAAFDLYSSTNPTDELDRAFLSAMAAAVTRLTQGFGGEDDVEIIELAADALGLNKPSDQVGALMRSARNDLYEAVSAFVRTAVNDEAAPSVKAVAVRLLALLPDDREAGKTPTGETVRVGDLREALLGEKFAPELHNLVKALMEAKADSQEEEKALDALIAFAAAHPDFAKGRQVSEVLTGAYSSIFRGAAVHSLAASGTRGLRMMEKIRRALPPGAMIDMSGTTRTAAGWIRDLQSKGAAALPAREQFSVLRARLLDAAIASAEEQVALSEIIAFARTHTLEAKDSNWLRENLLIVFQNSAGNYLEDTSGNARCLSMMRQIAEYLPSGTTMEFAGATATLRQHVDKVQAAGALMARLPSDPDAFRAFLEDLKRQQAGHQQQPLRNRQPKQQVERAQMIANVIAVAIVIAVVAAWVGLAAWLFGLFSGNVIAQVIVVLLALALPVLGIRKLIS